LAGRIWVVNFLAKADKTLPRSRRPSNILKQRS
jgi:hypothetical protein